MCKYDNVQVCKLSCEGMPNREPNVEASDATGAD